MYFWSYVTVGNIIISHTHYINYGNECNIINRETFIFIYQNNQYKQKITVFNMLYVCWHLILSEFSFFPFHQYDAIVNRVKSFGITSFKKKLCLQNAYHSWSQLKEEKQSFQQFKYRKYMLFTRPVCCTFTNGMTEKIICFC